jgi:LuxR family maltose regulon positive regulatory protein
VAHPEIETVLQSSLGAALVAAGRLDAAGTAFAAAAAHGCAAGSLPSVVDALGQQALLAAVRGELSRASALAERSLRLSAGHVAAPAARPVAADVTLAYVHTERYELAAGRACVARVDARHPGAGEPLAAVALALAEARLRRAAGDLPGALGVLQDAARRAGLPPALARLVRREQRSGVDPAARRRQEAAGAQEPAVAAVERLVASAAWRLQQGDVPSACLDLEHALQLAAPERSRRAFRQADEAVRHLLRPQEELSARHPWLEGDTVARRSSPGSTAPECPALAVPGPRRASDLLSDADHQVLRQLVELRTAEEIAARTSVSVDTTRTSVRHVLRTLAASSRDPVAGRSQDPSRPGRASCDAGVIRPG